MINLIDTAQPHTQQGAISDSATELVVQKVGVAARPVPPFVATSMQGGLITHESESVLVTAIQDNGSTETWTIQRSYGDAAATAHGAGTEWMPGTVTARDMMALRWNHIATLDPITEISPAVSATEPYPGAWTPYKYFRVIVERLETTTGEPNNPLFLHANDLDMLTEGHAVAWSRRAGSNYTAAAEIIIFDLKTRDATFISRTARPHDSYNIISGSLGVANITSLTFSKLVSRDRYAEISIFGSDRWV